MSWWRRRWAARQPTPHRAPPYPADARRPLRGRALRPPRPRPAHCYPGDDFVDIIGIDYYDRYPASPAGEFARTAQLPDSVYPLFGFARARNKKFSVSEWGVVVTLSSIALSRPGRPPRPRPTVPGRAGMAAIRVYRRWLTRMLPTRCRHTPTCSAYGLEAVRRYGLVIGSRLIAGRLDRCKAPTPYGTADPVP